MRQPALATGPIAAFSRSYPGCASQIRAVRADLQAMLGDCPLAADIILTLSELAANAALHSKSCDPGGQFTVRAEIHPGDYAWVEVEDEGGTWTQPPADPIGGHGLDVVRALASDWGIDDCLGSRVVWARIEWPDHG